MVEYCLDSSETMSTNENRDLKNPLTQVGVLTVTVTILTIMEYSSLFRIVPQVPFKKHEKCLFNKLDNYFIFL